ncbi:hypothetical protein [Moraxella nonliquefaciens]|uniref:hypothetical protein n=1 Tax=Moraxella nonliquefaciens TaxID=478 RepID=UPI0012E7E995|nr:hypothetical protein [Moraxella nonliquefaciens]
MYKQRFYGLALAGCDKNWGAIYSSAMTFGRAFYNKHACFIQPISKPFISKLR